MHFYFRTKFAAFAIYIFSLAFDARAGTYTFIPSDPDLGDLDHHNAVSWGITDTAVLQNQLQSGHRISSATIYIENIWDWKVEKDKLFINLLDNPKADLRNYPDNTSDTVLSNYFTETNSNNNRNWSNQLLLTTWSDPKGGYGGQFSIDYSYNFSSADLSILTAYLSNANSANRAAFGLGFDPDCHYFNEGVKLVIHTEKVAIPDSGSSLVLFGFGIGVVLVWRRRIGNRS